MKRRSVYLRLLQLEKPHSYAPEEEERLRECVSGAPGVTCIAKVERHPRGGYAVHIDAPQESLIAVVEYLRARGYAAVL